eukprot:COSAG06_NODE_3136_length_5804_cov_2.662752_6_plen_74_part_00
MRARIELTYVRVHSLSHLHTGKQNTRWVTGTATRKNGELSEFVEQGFGGNPTTGEKETRLFVGSMSLLRGICA